MHRKTCWTIALAAALCVSTGSFANDQGSTNPPSSSTSASTAGPAGVGASASSSAPLYTVKDGTKVDTRTLQGWKTWRALACERCHGAQQEGLVGPSLVERLKTLSRDDFHKLMLSGRPEKGMPNFGGSQMVQQNWEGLYAYLKGRSDGQIQPGHLSPLDPSAK